MTRQTTKKLVWAIKWNPFSKDGPFEVFGCEMQVGDPINIHGSFQAHIVRSPLGRTYVVDQATGVVLSDNWAAVKEGIAKSGITTEQFMRNHRSVADFIKDMKKVNRNDFFEKLISL